MSYVMEQRRKEQMNDIEKHLKALTPQEIGWIAGFFDGEGTFQIIRKTYLCKTKQRITNEYTARVNISSTTEAPLKWLHQKLGGKNYFRIYRTAPKIQWKDQYKWELDSSKAIPFCEAIIPYLKVKQEVAKLILELQKGINSYKRKGRTVESNELGKREALYLKARELNMRGRTISLVVVKTQKQSV